MPDQYWVFEADTNICEFIFVINTYNKYIVDEELTIFFKIETRYETCKLPKTFFVTYWATYT